MAAEAPSREAHVMLVRSHERIPERSHCSVIELSATPQKGPESYGLAPDRDKLVFPACTAEGSDDRLDTASHRGGSTGRGPNGGCGASGHSRAHRGTSWRRCARGRAPP